MKKFILITIIASYVYTIYLSITLFLVPAFKTYFSLYGVLGTFLIWLALTVAGYLCGYFGMKVWTTPDPQATYKETDNA